MAISRDQVDEIKSRVSIIDVAAERVNLSRHGSTMSCCCPFHQEKTPSCVLYEKTNSFYCFGCGTSGDVISFIRGTDNLSYVEAVQQLAQRAGITIDAKGAQLNQREQELRDRIRACNREAARYFFRSLTQDDEGSVGRTYLLNERGLSMAAVRHFGLGYAKPESFGLVNYLRDKGFTDDEMITANLAYQSKTGHVMDRFRDRIMYPIFDTVGNVIAFGGRALNKEDKAKYINTNTTPVFRKSNNLYGYNFARKAHSDHLILAEGYMDVIALQTAGFAGAVASLGTSLTEEQAKLIGRSCKELTICYDSDSAGIRATQRAIQVLRSACPELRVSVASLGEGKDPDEFIKMHSEDGAERLAEAFKAAISDTEYRLQMCKNGLDMNVNKDRLTYAVEAVRVLATVENPVEQDLFAAQIAAEVGVGRESILAQVQAAATDPANKTVPEEIKDEEIFEPEEEPTQRYHAFIRPVSDAESEVVAFADVIINEDYRINGVRLVLDEHNRFSALMPAYLAKDRCEWVPYVELKPEIEREMTAFLARNFDFNSEVEVIGGGTAIDVGETKLTLRKAANRNTVKAYAELQNDVFALKYGKIMEGKRGYFYSPPSMGTYIDQNGNKQYQYAYGFASAPERTRISGEIKKQYELMCLKNKQVYEAKIK